MGHLTSSKLELALSRTEELTGFMAASLSEWVGFSWKVHFLQAPPF